MSEARGDDLTVDLHSQHRLESTDRHEELGSLGELCSKPPHPAGINVISRDVVSAANPAAFNQPQYLSTCTNPVEMIEYPILTIWY